MNPRLVEYYNRELAYLREVGAEFAAAFPKVAGASRCATWTLRILTWSGCWRVSASSRRGYR